MELFRFCRRSPRVSRTHTFPHTSFIVVYVQVLGLRGGGARAVLADALQPPTMSMINDALSVLVAMGALERDTNMIAATVADLDRQEKLTPLGKVCYIVNARCYSTL